MSPSTYSSKFYQIGGFRPQIQWYRSDYDDKKLARVIVGNDSPLRTGDMSEPGVELILGIERTGSSHLLITEDETLLFASSLNLPFPRVPPLVASAFSSLSPIRFASPEELVKKLSTLKPKSHKGREPSDTSQANKHYGTGTAGISRGAFEHGRVIRLALKSPVKAGRYGVRDVSWSQSIRICSFVFNTPALDHRPSRERMLNPTILDVGWAEVDSSDVGTRPITAIHYLFAENKLLNQGNKKVFEYGQSEIANSTAISEHVQTFFKDHSLSSRPMILLVHGEDKARNALRKLGVDITTWKSGISELLGKVDPMERAADSSKGRAVINISRQGDAYEARRNRARSRSRSPYSAKARPSRSRLSSSPTRRNSSLEDQENIHKYASVYLVDVHSLYKAMMETDYLAQNVLHMARQLGLTSESGWCAGNEAVLIIDIWRSMISGPAIDEQRTMRSVKQEEAHPAMETSILLGSDSDDERDPNDIVYEPSAEKNSWNPYEPDSDSDDYGSD